MRVHPAGRFLGSFLCLLSLTSGCGGQDPVAEPEGSASTDGIALHPAPAQLYDEGQVLDFKLTFSSEQWAMFQAIHNNPPPSDQRDSYTKVYVHCGFEALGVKFEDAACRPKGNPDYWKDEKKAQFVVKFDHWNKDGRFLTLRRLNLEAAPFVMAPVRDRLGMWLMRQAGLDAPRVNHARVYLNGALLGLYMNVEQIDKEFIQSHFTKSKGNLYSQGQYLETNTSIHDTSRLTTLLDLVQDEPPTGDHARFFTQIDQLMDLRVLLAQTAAEVVLPTGDNFSNGGTNFFYYDDPATARFILLPWDLDTIADPELAPASANPYSFWGASSLGLKPNKLLQLLYQNPAWKSEFESNLVRLRDTVYSKLPAYAESVCAQIRGDVLKDPNAYAPIEDFDRDCAYIKKHVADRTAYLTQTLKR
ncbi:MAG: CotH kinase family protein [Polyangia bacterium]